MKVSEDHELMVILYKFLGIVSLLIGIGMLFIYSASSVYAYERFGSAHYYFHRQLISLFVGLCAAASCAFFPLFHYKKLIPFIFIGSLLLTALTLVPGIGVSCHGSRRWLLGTSLQPSELLKCSLFLYVSYFVDKKKFELHSFSLTFVPLLSIIALSALVLLCQPDFGSVVTIVITMFFFFFVIGIKMRYLWITIGWSVPLAIILIVKKTYRLQRILIYLNPWVDPQGKGFQIIQSLVAIGSGRVWGRGIAYSKQKFFYLPMQHTDFIFSIIAEEMGLIGAVSLVLLYVLFIWYGFQLAQRMQLILTQGVIFNSVFFIALQAFMNMMVATAMLPTKGLALPFISYGGSVLVSSLCMIGLIVNAVYFDQAAHKRIIDQRSYSLSN